MGGGETDNRPSGEQEDEVAPPGWYPDPNGYPGLRRWDGQRWTLEDSPLPTPDVGAGSWADAEESSPRPFNWPALVATLLAASVVAYFLLPSCSWEEDGAFVYASCLQRDRPTAYDALLTFVSYPAPPLLFLFGLLGARRKYGPSRWVGIGLAGLGGGLLAISFLWWLMWRGYSDPAATDASTDAPTTAGREAPPYFEIDERDWVNGGEWASLGEEVSLGDWDVVVTKVARNANEAIADADWDNDEPNGQFVLVTYQATYNGPDRSADVEEWTWWSFVGSDNVAYGESFEETPLEAQGLYALDIGRGETVTDQAAVRRPEACDRRRRHQPHGMGLRQRGQGMLRRLHLLNAPGLSLGDRALAGGNSSGAM